MPLDAAPHAADGAELSRRRGLDPVAVRRWLARNAVAPRPWLHDEVGRRLVEHLDPLRTAPARLVEWWPRSGGLDAHLARRFPNAQRLGVEAAARLAAAAAEPARPWWRRLGAPERPNVVSDDDTAIGSRLGGPPDLVVANMVLQAVLDVPALFARWHGLLAPGGVAAFAAPGPGTLPELRTVYAREGWPPPSPLFIDMHDLGDMLVEAGFATPVLDQETLVLTFADAASALAELRGLGGNLHPSRHPGLRTPRFRERLLRGLEGCRDRAGRVTLTFEIAYGHGFRTGPAARPRPGEPVPVSLERLRHGRGTPGSG